MLQQRAPVPCAADDVAARQCVRYTAESSHPQCQQYQHADNRCCNGADRWSELYMRDECTRQRTARPCAQQSGRCAIVRTNSCRPRWLNAVGQAPELSTGSPQHVDEDIEGEARRSVRIIQPDIKDQQTPMTTDNSEHDMHAARSVRRAVYAPMMSASPARFAIHTYGDSRCPTR